MKVSLRFVASVMMLASVASAAKDGNLRKLQSSSSSSSSPQSNEMDNNGSDSSKEENAVDMTGRFRRHLKKKKDGKYDVLVHYVDGHDQHKEKVDAMPGCDVHMDFEDMNTFAMSVDDDGMEELENDPTVDMVEEDYPRYLMDMPDDWEGNNEDGLDGEGSSIEGNEIWGDFSQIDPNLDTEGMINELHDQIVKGRDHDNSRERRRRMQTNNLPSGLYGLSQTQAIDTWPYARGAGKTVCVIDSGLDEDHQDFSNKGVRGVQLSNGLTWFQDGLGHGTHVAGTIGAEEGTSGILGRNRVTGVAPDVNLLIVRVFDNGGRFVSASSLIDAALACEQNGADITNMSLGGGGASRTEENAFIGIRQRGTLVIASAGNSGNTQFSYPASYQTIMSVAAIDRNRRLASFSQRNSRVDIAGPGVSVLSSRTGGGVTTKSGTSMSSPHVAGVAALVWSFRPNASANDVERALINSAVDLGAAGRDNSYGNGLVQALRGIEELKGSALTEDDLLDAPEPPNDGDGGDNNDGDGGDNNDGDGGDNDNNTNRCSNGQTYFAVEMNTGRGGFQTSYYIDREDGSRAVSRGPFRPFQDRLDEFCANDQSCFTFTITDLFGNGLTGDGEFRVIYGNDVILQGSDFGSEASVEFGAACEPTRDEPPPQPVELFTLIVTDFRPFDTAARLDDVTTGETIWNYTSGYASRTRYEIVREVDPTHCYEVTVTDRAGNGMCCSFGEGGFGVWFDGERQGTATNFGSAASIQAGNCN